MTGESKAGDLEFGNFWRWLCIVGMVAACLVLAALNLLFIAMIFFNKNRKAEDLPGLLVVLGIFALFLMVAVVITVGLIRNKPSERGGYLIPLVVIRGAGICFIVVSVLLALKGDFGLVRMVKGSLMGMAMLFAGISWERFTRRKGAVAVSDAGKPDEGGEEGVTTLVSRPEELAEMIENSSGRVLVVYGPPGNSGGKEALDGVLHVQGDLRDLGVEIAVLAPDYADLAHDLAEAGYRMEGWGGDELVLALFDRNGLVHQWIGEDGLTCLLQWLVAENADSTLEPTD